MVWRIACLLEYALICAATIVLIGAGALWLSPFRMLRVQTDSMKPVFAHGDVIIAERRKAPVRTGQIVTYRTPSNLLIAHRVVGTLGNRLITRGDAIARNDDPISKAQVQGTVVLVVNRLGKLFDAVHTPLGFLCWVILPSVLIVSVELVQFTQRLKPKGYRMHRGQQLYN